MSEQKTQKNYKATFILDLRGYQEPVETLIDKLKNILQSIEGEVGEVENLGIKDFRRVTNRKFPSGHYVQIHFASPIGTPKLLREKLRLDKTVYRIFVQQEEAA